MTPLIVNVMPHGPAYDFEPDTPPEHHWPGPDGRWIGFWTREWPDLLGAAMLRRRAGVRWEVWQPDERADRPYAKELPSGVTHRLFPAAHGMARPGILARPALRSPALVAALDALPVGDALVILHGYRVPLHDEILWRAGRARRWPVLVLTHGMCRAPVSELGAPHRPLTYVDIVAEQVALWRALRHAAAITVQNWADARELRRVYRGRLERLTMGCDFDFWTPAPGGEARAALRAARGIAPGKTVLLATGNFVPRKQLDRLLEACAPLRERGDFLLLIAGHGDAAATARLRALCAPLAARGAAMLHPYVSGPALRELYWLSDVYASTSTAEGSSVGVMKAMACGLPVLTTPVGETWERMVAARAGRIIPVDGSAPWTAAIAEILDGARPAPLDRDLARRAYDWSQIARRFDALSTSLLAGATVPPGRSPAAPVGQGFGAHA